MPLTMPSLIDLRRRIRAVKNTQQITKAMKMVAASKLRRAQERIMSARPYALQMQRVLASVASRVDPSIHPLLDRPRARPGQQDARDRRHRRQGAVRQLQHEHHQGGRRASSRAAPQPCALGLVGRKGRDFFGRRGFAVLFEQVGIFQKLRFDDAQTIAQTAIDAFTSERGRSRHAGLQRVQVGHDAARRRRSAAADRARGGRGPGGARRRRIRSTTCTSRRRRRSSTSCCRATSRCRSTARCSSRTRRSSPRR